MVVILISIFAFVLETIPRYRLDANGEERTDSHPTFAVIEIFCIGWFTVEYVMRLYAAKGWRLKWLRQPLNIIDLVAILPYYISLTLSSGAVGSAFVIVRILRLIRVTRLFKFSRHSYALRVRHELERAHWMGSLGRCRWWLARLAHANCLYLFELLSSPIITFVWGPLRHLWLTHLYL
jgi:hypothetical protein